MSGSAPLAAEARARISDEIVRQLSAGVHVWRFEPGDPGSARLIASNPAACELTGTRAEGSIGRTLRELFPALLTSGLPAAIRHILEDGRPRPLVELSFESGSHRRFQGQAFLATPGDVAVVFEERREPDPFDVPGPGAPPSEDVRQRVWLEEQLRQSQKMEAVGRLAGGVAHDFNNLLTAILGYSSIALASLEADHPLRRDLEEIHVAGERAAALTRQLLTFSRRQVMQPRPIDLNAIVRGLELMIGRLIGEGVTLATDCEPDLAAIVADPLQLELVLINLAVNARDAMPKGGTLTIRTASEDVSEPKAEAYPDAAPGPHVVLVVEDTGTGMDHMTLSHLFEPFFTTKDPGKGTGLGLSTVYGVVHQSGGHIRVESQVGEGSRFQLCFPSAGARMPHAGATWDAGWDTTASARTVLLIEEEPAIRRMLVSILRPAGYRVFEAASADEAMEIARRHEGAIDLVLADAATPGRGGEDLIEELRRAVPGLAVVIMSGYVDEEEPRRRSDGGAFLLKPFTRQDLLGVLQASLDRQGHATKNG